MAVGGPDQHSWRLAVSQVVKWPQYNSSSCWTVSTRRTGELEGRNPARRDLISIPKVRAHPRRSTLNNITITKAEGFLPFELRRRSYNLILSYSDFSSLPHMSRRDMPRISTQVKETDLKEGPALSERASETTETVERVANTDFPTDGHANYASDVGRLSCHALNLVPRPYRSRRGCRWRSC